MSEAETNGKSPTSGRKFERSSIDFPYGSLKDAEEIAHSLHSKWGDDADIDQLAAGMSSTRNSGTFRSKLGTARTFGVLEPTPGRATLTKLGKDLIDPKTAASGRVEAFLRVALFKSLYEKHKSSLLPPNEALENEIRELGVSSKQTDRARQSFQRSAEQAGFFALGKDRLTMPNVGKGGAGEEMPKPPADTGASLGFVNANAYSPQAIALLSTLLGKDASAWSDEKIVQLVRLARDAQDLFK